MIIKIKGFFLLIFLLLLQSCSGGRIGNFLELSFDNLEKKENEKSDIKKQKNENSESVSENKKVSNLEKKENKKKNIEEKKVDKPKKINKNINFQKKNKNELQSYKIILILKEVDPKDPIEVLSTILRNSELNFEIEKIERFLDSKKR